MTLWTGTVPFAEFPPWCRQSFAIRVWDGVSRSQLGPEPGVAFEAGDIAWSLNDRQNRVTALATHADHGVWKGSPFISATLNGEDARFRANRQSLNGKRGSVFVTVINLKARWRAGLPFLLSVDEMKYYGVKDPYRRNYQYYQDEILCPWIITHAEIVETWAWEDVSRFLQDGTVQDWVDTVVIPAVEGHESESLSRWSQIVEPKNNADEMDSLDQSLKQLQRKLSSSSTFSSSFTYGEQSHRPRVLWRL